MNPWPGPAFQVAYACSRGLDIGTEREGSRGYYAGLPANGFPEERAITDALWNLRARFSSVSGWLLRLQRPELDQRPVR
jgi:hypothetical protein